MIFYYIPVCNITISSFEVRQRSGRSFGEIESPSDASGPIFCWYKLQADPGERIEIQIYRIKRLGKLDEESKRYVVLFPENKNYF